MPDALIHPTSRELAAFGRGQLAEATAAAVASHLNVCPVCRQVVETLSPGSFRGQVRTARPDESSLPPGRSATLLGGTSGGRNEVSASPPPPTELPPELLNHPRYRMIRELGRGGMGVVYQAVQTLMDRHVAVKVINPSVLAHPDVLPRFQSEVKTAAKLDHPNIVRAHDAEQVGSLHLLVMEYVEGTNLADLVQRKGPLPIPHACHFIRQAALGLQHAFEQGMVHRDIKPQNLMVTSKGVVKILDFGLARLRGGQTRGGGLTEAGSFMGTPEYVSPEQATDARTADTRADLYSLGCTLYFLLTGQPPFAEDTAVKMILAHIEKEAPSVQALRPEVPAALSAVVARLLAKDPKQRYQQPVELARALVPFINATAKPGATPAEGPPPRPSAPAAPPALGTDTRKASQLPTNAPAKSPVQDASIPTGPADPFTGLAGGSLPPPPNAGPVVAPTPAGWYRHPPVLAGFAAALLALGLGVWLLVGLISRDKVTTTVAGELNTGKSDPIPVHLEPVRIAVVPPEERSNDPIKTKESPTTKREPKAMRPRIKAPPPTKPAPPLNPANTPKPPDPVAIAVQSAREDYDAALKKASERVLAAFEQKLATLTADSKMKNEDRLKAVKDLEAEKVAFQKKGTLPWSPRMRSAALEYLDQINAATIPLGEAYDQALAAYQRQAGKDQAARALAAEKEQILTPKVVGVWKCRTVPRARHREQFSYTLYANGQVGGTSNGKDTWKLTATALEITLYRSTSKSGRWMDMCTIATSGQDFSGKPGNRARSPYAGKLVRESN